MNKVDSVKRHLANPGPSKSDAQHKLLREELKNRARAGYSNTKGMEEAQRISKATKGGK